MPGPTSADAGRSRRLRRLRRRAVRLPAALADGLRRVRDFISIDDITIDLYERRARRRGPKVGRLQLRRTAPAKFGDPDAWMVVAREGDAPAERDDAASGPVFELEAGASSPDPATPEPPRDPR
ncbi:MAG: hypothetical protein OXG38_07290 [Chloroflexi bacterium]|nr:hypothetical protein [Chloroflexota bacterium]